MNLVDYGRIILRRGWIIILLALIAGASAFLLSREQTPVYRSTQRMLMNPSRSDFGLTQATRTLLNSRVAYLQSTLTAGRVIDELQLDMTPNELNGEVTVIADPNSLQIQIDVDLEDGELANDIARVYGDELQRHQDDLNQQARREDRINTQPQDNPSYYQLSPNIPINTLVGIIAGGFIGAIVVFILEYLDSNIVRRRTEVEKVLELPVLAAVPGGDS